GGGTHVSGDGSPDGVLGDEPLLTPDELRDLVDYRRGVEGGAAWLPAGRGGGPPGGVLGDEPLLTPDELRDLVDFRRVVEGGAAWLAAERATVEQIDYLEALVREMKETQGFDPWSERDGLFHLIVADASGSRRLPEAVAGGSRGGY